MDAWEEEILKAYDITPNDQICPYPNLPDIQDPPVPILYVNPPVETQRIESTRSNHEIIEKKTWKTGRGRKPKKYEKKTISEKYEIQIYHQTDFDMQHISNILYRTMFESTLRSITTYLKIPSYVFESLKNEIIPQVRTYVRSIDDIDKQNYVYQTSLHQLIHKNKTLKKIIFENQSLYAIPFAIFIETILVKFKIIYKMPEFKADHYENMTKIISNFLCHFPDKRYRFDPLFLCTVITYVLEGYHLRYRKYGEFKNSSNLRYKIIHRVYSIKE